MDDEQLQVVLSAIDKNLTSVVQAAVDSLNDLSKANDSLASKSSSTSSSVSSGTQRMTGGFMQMASAMGAVAVAAKAFDVVKDAVGGAVQRYDTLNKYPKVMQALGYSSKDVAASSKTLNNGIQGLPTSLDEITKSAQQLAPLTGGANKAAQSAVALNDAFLASSASSEDASRGLLQYTQMLSSGKVDMMSWRTLMETMPISLRKVANAFGFTGKSAEQDLYQALQSGKITMDQLNDKFIELDKGASGFGQLAKVNSAGISNAMENAKISVTKGITGIIAAIDTGLKQNNLPGIVDIITNAGNAIGNVAAKVAGKMPAFISAIAPFLKALKPIAPALKVVAAGFVGLGIIAMVSSKIAPAITVFSSLNKAVRGVASGFTGLISKLNPFGSAGKTAGEGLSETASGAQKISSTTPQASTGASSLAKNIALIGVGVGAAALGMGVLVLAISKLAGTGSAGAAALIGVTAAMTVLIGVLTLAGSFLGELGPQAAIAYAGMAVLVASFALLTASITAFANTGNQGLVALAAVTASIILLTAVMAVLSPILTAGAVGLVAFGAAVLMIGAGIGLATAGIALLITAFNNLNTSASTIVSTMAAIGQGLAMMLTTFIATLATQIPVIAAALMQMITGFLQALATAMPQIVNAGAQLVVNFIEGIASNLGQIITAALDLLQAFVDGLSENMERIVDIAMQAVMTFVYGVGYALGRIAASGTQLISTFVSGIIAGFSKSTSAGKGASNAAINGVKSMVSGMIGAGKNLVMGLVNGIKSGLKWVVDAAKSVAESAVNAAKSALKIHSPSRVMRDEVGYFVSAGMAKGILNNVGLVSDAVNTLSQAAVIDIPAANTNHFNASLNSINARMNDLGMSVDGTLSANNIIDNTSSRNFEARMEMMMQETIKKLNNVDQTPVVTVDTMNRMHRYTSKSDALAYAMWKGV